MNEKKYPRALTIAGSDSGGGAGVQADLKTFSAVGCFGMTVITALTAQNTLGVTGIHDVPAEFIEKQGDAVLADIGTDAVKIGMLHSPETISAVIKLIEKYSLKNIVLDPVMVATSGDKLIKDETIAILIRDLFPLVDIITPNLPEAEVILNRKIKTSEEMADAARNLSTLCKRAVLLKGGHLFGEKVYDYFIEKNNPAGVMIIENDKIETKNTHGTGCTLSSAIASYLALGYELSKAVSAAEEFVHKAILYGAGVKTGNGHGPVNHFFDPSTLKIVKR
jgi:hydroxymethylpyrimidine/phosphomethylpyrimidine kinase